MKRNLTGTGRMDLIAIILEQDKKILELERRGTSMTVAEGKYDEEANVALLSTDAKALVLIVFGGNKGDGISVKLQTTLGTKTMDIRQLAELIREVANGLDADRKEMA